MKIVHSYWSEPFVSRNEQAGGAYAGGGCDKPFFYMSWALSCLSLKSLYGEVELSGRQPGDSKQNMLLKMQMPGLPKWGGSNNFLSGRITSIRWHFIKRCLIRANVWYGFGNICLW